MSSLRRHLRQRVLWKQWTGADQWDNATYSEPVEIPARVEEKVRLGSGGSGAGGSTALATTNIIVEADVRLGDLLAVDLTDPLFEEVETRDSYVDLGGQVRGYKCYLEPVTRT